MIPGSNILNLALSVIARAPFDYYAFTSRSVNELGQYQANYAAPVPLTGSVQPVPRTLYEQYGLDFQKNYLLFYVSQLVIDVQRDVSGDLMNFGGNTYQCLSNVNWFAMDGWVCVLAVQTQNVPLVSSISYPAAGEYDTGDTLDFAITFNIPVAVTGTPFIALSALSGLIGGNAAYIAGTGTKTLTFRYTVLMADTAAGIAAASPVSTINNVGAVVGTLTAGNVPANASFVVLDLSGVTLNA